MRLKRGGSEAGLYFHHFSSDLTLSKIHVKNEKFYSSEGFEKNIFLYLSLSRLSTSYSLIKSGDKPINRRLEECISMEAHNTKQLNSTYNYIMLAYYQYIEKGLQPDSNIISYFMLNFPTKMN